MVRGSIADREVVAVAVKDVTHITSPLQETPEEVMDVTEGNVLVA